MRLLTQPEKELIKKIAQIANGSSSPIPAYKFLLADKDIASLDDLLKKDVFQKHLPEIGRPPSDNNFEDSLVKLLLGQIHGRQIVTLYELLILLNDQGYLKLVKSYRYGSIDFSLHNTVQNPSYVLITENDKELLRSIAGYDVELYLPFFLLANNGGETYEESVLNYAKITAEKSEKTEKDAKKTLEEAISQTKISKWALGITVVASLISIGLSIASIIISIK